MNQPMTGRKDGQLFRAENVSAVTSRKDGSGGQTGDRADRPHKRECVASVTTTEHTVQPRMDDQSS